MLSRVFWTFVVLVLAVTVAKLYVFDVVKIDNDEMAPTIVAGDVVLVNRRFSAIARGDVVLARHPEDPERLLVRRVVGVGGDEVEVRNGALVVNDRPVERAKAGEIVLPQLDADRGRRAYSVEAERLGEREYRTVHASGAKPRDGARRPLTGVFYLLGDNRSDALDSRSFGPVKPGFVRGKVWMILSASNRAGPSFDPRQRRFSVVR